MAQISPVFNLPFFTDVNGNPLAGGLIYTYEAGSFSTAKVTYTSEAGDVENTNPIVLDSAGMLAGVAIWLEDGELYNLVLTDANGSPLKSFDDVTGVYVPSSSSSSASPIWVLVAGGTYLSPTSFLVPGDYTQQFVVGNRVRVTQSGFTYGIITSVGFSSGNTTVTIINDGVALNPALTAVEYSVLFPAPNETVDAGGVSYFEAMPYSLANTVGNKIKLIDVEVAAVEARRVRDEKVYATTGSGDTYAIDPTPAITSYTTSSLFTVRFTNAASGGSTINVNGLGAKSLQEFNSSGTLVDAVIPAGLVSDIAYNSTTDTFVLLDPIPAAAVVTPRGMTLLTSNTTYTVPAGVYYLKVTAIGGGGGGGGGTTSGDIESGWSSSYGGSGGGAATSSSVIATTPGTNYAVTVGAGGAGTTGTGATGGTSTFGGSVVTAGGGSGGSTSNSGAGGTSGIGTLVVGGNRGAGSVGGGSTYGGGGSGGFGSGGAGSSGTAGAVIVEY